MMLSGSRRARNSSKSAGKVFFLAKSPEAPTTTTLRLRSPSEGETPAGAHTQSHAAHERDAGAGGGPFGEGVRGCVRAWGGDHAGYGRDEGRDGGPGAAPTAPHSAPQTQGDEGRGTGEGRSRRGGGHQACHCELP